MTPDTRDWLDGLREFAAAERLARPPREPTERPDAAAFVAAQRAVLAAHFSTWIDGSLLGVLEARRRLAAADTKGDRRGGLDPDPAVVITTSPAGLTAIEAVLGRDDLFIADIRPAIACVREVECRLWCIRRPDPEHHRHVNHWSWIKTEVPKQRWPAFGRHRLGPHESYWLHRTGTSGAGEADARACHLWKWNGATAVLLEPFIDEAVGRL